MCPRRKDKYFNHVLHIIYNIIFDINNRQRFLSVPYFKRMKLNSGRDADSKYSTRAQLR